MIPQYMTGFPGAGMMNPGIGMMNSGMGVSMQQNPFMGAAGPSMGNFATAMPGGLGGPMGMGGAP
jgi:hypothetical protein